MNSKRTLSLPWKPVSLWGMLPWLLGLLLTAHVSLNAAEEIQPPPAKTAEVIQLEAQVSQLNSQVATLTQRELTLKRYLDLAAKAALVSSILFAALAAIWAVKTDRNPLAWFFYGLLLNLLILLTIFAKETEARNPHSGSKKKSRYRVYY